MGKSWSITENPILPCKKRDLCVWFISSAMVGVKNDQCQFQSEAINEASSCEGFCPIKGCSGTTAGGMRSKSLSKLLKKGPVVPKLPAPQRPKIKPLPTIYGVPRSGQRIQLVSNYSPVSLSTSFLKIPMYLPILLWVKFSQTQLRNTKRFVMDSKV